MSEEILKALMQLFAIISKQNNSGGMNNLKYVREFLMQQIAAEKIPFYLELYNSYFNEGEQKESKLTSMKDSVRTLSICKKINKTLSHKQKVIVLFRICEFINNNPAVDSLQKEIAETVGKTFNVDRKEYDCIMHLTSIKAKSDLLDMEGIRILMTMGENVGDFQINYINKEGLTGFFVFAHIASSNTVFFRFMEESNVYMNGLAISVSKGYILSHGATIRTSKGVIFYNEIIMLYNDTGEKEKIVFDARIPKHVFKGNKVALHDISIHEEGGSLFGIMGASGAGKTTLLNVLSGLERSTGTSITINGNSINSHEARGSIGYIPQDDLLMEELTVYQNLYYNAKLCNREWTNSMIVKKVIKVLSDLGLGEIRDVKVGNALNKKISGGQRKRLNIALELIREPGVLFVDEPTSGLSSRDSENVMDLLKQLSQEGKIIFVVIHQPSSEIYKLFDKMFILDKGGWPVYYGNSIEAVIYFKTITNQINKEIGECHSCGNVNPELIFNTIEDRELDEYGNHTLQRKHTPEQWNNYYKENHKPFIGSIGKTKLKGIRPPGLMKQFIVFFSRDFLSRISDIQYILIALLEAPLLAFILSVIIRKSDNNKEMGYVFHYNENIPAYIFMLVIVSLFVGLSISAEEIFKDRKIIKRESFLRLSRLSYINSKIIYLIMLSLLQSSLLVLVGNLIVEMEGMFIYFWIVCFSVFVFGNIVGLILSSSFNSIVTIYVIIPIILIPQMILGGAMFRFENLSPLVGGGYRVPFIADLMISRWAYEGLIVGQYMYNEHELQFYEYNRLLSKYNYRTSVLLPHLTDLVEEHTQNTNDSVSMAPPVVIETLRHEIALSGFVSDANWKTLTSSKALVLIFELSNFYQKKYNILSKKKDVVIFKHDKNNPDIKIADLKLQHSNESIEEILTNSIAREKLYEEDGVILQNMDQIYMTDHIETGGRFNSNPMFVPYKRINNIVIAAFWYNLFIIWVFNFICYLFLYTDFIRKILSLDINIFKKNR